ncbi:zinc-dependent peptidase [Chryseolinea lacunae]|uniref:Zinc-dependent peptidase n=1 Tax=Chryseolinea lacunae TaxID=2801331 RepID=A0ABS1KY23_9BACT|nr:zinc-dependent peptidase [Chryseolinea lacunae]MBL0744346.1 zinc-dependent peptidase [Chryseolinea lacunae]
MIPFFIIIAFCIGFGIFYSRQHQKKVVTTPIPEAWKAILRQNVTFYTNLPASEKQRFENDVMRFLANVRITGIETTLDITDKLLVASSAAIPVFGFPDWDYTFLDEVLLYPGHFDRDYDIGSKNEAILGMVGSGTLEGKMILSQPALRAGFANRSDKQNVGIHEFVHLLDKEDGSVDGVPTVLNDKAYAGPWLQLIHASMKDILKGKSDINVYGATNEQEFLAVVGEYFFERPQLLQKNHPQLYTLLAQAFHQDTARLAGAAPPVRSSIQRNDPCPCGLDKKFKHCCGA